MENCCIHFPPQTVAYQSGAPDTRMGGVKVMSCEYIEALHRPNICTGFGARQLCLLGMGRSMDAPDMCSCYSMMRIRQHVECILVGGLGSMVHMLPNRNSGCLHWVHCVDHTVLICTVGSQPAPVNIMSAQVLKQSCHRFEPWT